MTVVPASVKDLIKTRTHDFKAQQQIRTYDLILLDFSPKMTSFF